MSRQSAQIVPWQKSHTLASPAQPNGEQTQSIYSVIGRLTRILTAPQRALICERVSPGARFIRQAASHPRTTSSYSPMKRAIALAANGLPPPQLPAADSSNPVLLEMRKGVLLDVGNALNQFSEIDRTIRAFCEQCSDYIGQSKRLPRMTHQAALPKNSPVGTPAYEDYVFFAIIKTHLHGGIFRPFHPAASAHDSDRYEEELDKMNADEVANLIQGFARAIVGENGESCCFRPFHEVGVSLGRRSRVPRLAARLCRLLLVCALGVGVRKSIAAQCPSFDPILWLRDGVRQVSEVGVNLREWNWLRSTGDDCYGLDSESHKIQNKLV
jgi:hypothetical protein